MKPLDHTKRHIYFPPVEEASPEGLLAIGGDLDLDRLLVAYARGIFPWYNPGQPVLWWSPDPRTVLYPDDLKISRSLKKSLRNKGFQVTFDTAFVDVLRCCAMPRRGDHEPSTWITHDMSEAYQQLHAAGYAHSVECWRGDELVGGLYGVSMGRAFFGESMFSFVTDASKVALVKLVELLKTWRFDFIDCQLPSAHLFRLGAVEIPRTQFITELNHALSDTAPVGKWANRDTVSSGCLPFGQAQLK